MEINTFRILLCLYCALLWTHDSCSLSILMLLFIWWSGTIPDVPSMNEWILSKWAFIYIHFRRKMLILIWCVCIYMRRWQKKMDMSRENNYYCYDNTWLCQGSRIWNKCDVTRRQRPITRIVFITEKGARQHAQNSTFRLFACSGWPVGFISTCFYSSKEWIQEWMKEWMNEGLKANWQTRPLGAINLS